MPRDFKAVLFLLSLLTVLAVLFFVDSSIDLRISALFYDPQTHHFPLAYQKILRIIQKSVNQFVNIWTTLLVMGFLALTFAKHLPKQAKKIVPLTRRQIIFLFLAMLLGPGLVVNSIMKENYGRARPAETNVFGGDLEFSKPFVVTPYTSQSFVSGHASMGFYAVALAFVVAAHKRRQTYLCGLLIGCIVGAGRILQGRHFFSDVLFSAIITLIVIHILSLIILRPKLPGASRAG